jgi:hypothetical protein
LIACFDSAGATVTPSKEELEAKARHFANTVFVIGAGGIMLAASLLQPFAVSRLGANGSDIAFAVATLCILGLASMRSSFALFAIERQCVKYGHVPREGSSVCSRCFQPIADQPRTD